MILDSKSAQLRDMIKANIASGVYTLHSRLPSERRLSELFQVSRDTVRTALRELAEERILRRNQGRGTFVAARPAPQVRQTEKRFVLNIIMWNEQVYNQFYRDLFEHLFEHLNGLAEVRMYFTFELETFPVAPGPEEINLVYGMFAPEPLRAFCRRYPRTILLHSRLDDFNSISVDQRLAGELAAHALHDAGHRKIAAIRLSEGLNGSSDFRDRSYGVRNWLDSRDVPLAIDFYDHNWQPWQKCSLMVDYFLAKRPDITAIVCPFDQIAISLYDELRLRRIRIPEDISVISFDDYYYAQYLTPPLTTVGVGIEVLALRLYEGVETLRRGEKFQMKLEPFLVSRQSIRQL